MSDTKGKLSLGKHKKLEEYSNPSNRFAPNLDTCMSIAYNVEFNLFYLGGYQFYEIAMVDAESLDLIDHLEAHDDSVFSMVVDPSSRLLFSGGRDNHLCFWNYNKKCKTEKTKTAELSRKKDKIENFKDQVIKNSNNRKWNNLSHQIICK